MELRSCARNGPRLAGDGHVSLQSDASTRGTSGRGAAASPGEAARYDTAQPAWTGGCKVVESRVPGLFDALWRTAKAGPHNPGEARHGPAQDRLVVTCE